MSEATETPAQETPTVETTETPQFSPAEQAAIERGQQGLSEPPNPNVVPPSGPQRPEGVPEQFWKDGQVDVEGLAKSYAELRAKMDSKPAEQAPAEETPGEEGEDNGVKIGDQKPDEKAPEVSPVADAMEAARVEWAEKGELSEDSFAALEAQGIPRPIIDSYLEGVRLQQTQIENSIYDAAGGKEAYQAAIKWAAKGLTADEIAKFDNSLDDPAMRATAVAGLMARYQSANPSEGRLTVTNDGGAAGADVFTSRDEMLAAQRDARYQTDPVYRQQFVEKLARSQSGGFAAFERSMFQKQSFSN